MSLTFVNAYRAPMSVMFEYLRRDQCEAETGDPFVKVGWYNLATDQQMVVYNGDVHQVNRYWYFYALATDGATWSGPYPQLVRNSAFDECAALADNVHYHRIGMRELDVAGYSGYTMTLTA